MFEGVPTFPDAGRFWKIVEKFKVNSFYTAPTAIRALIRLGDEWPNKYDLSSLRVLGTVGEPINPEAWMWYHKHIGQRALPHRGHLVADRDRRTSDHAVARRAHAQTRQREPSVLRRRTGGPARRRHANASRTKAASCASRNRGPASCAPPGATTTGSSTPISPRSRTCISPATAAAWMPTAITG